MLGRPLFLLLALASGCSTAAGDDGPAGLACAEPDLSCPAEGNPTIGGPCEGELTCESVDPDGTEWTYDCAGGQWVASGGCRWDEELGEDVCSAPPLAERCTDPSVDELDGAIVRLGPGDISQPFRSFEPDERTDLVFGPQGGAMVSARLEVVGIDVPPCVGVHTTVSLANAGPYDDPRETAIPVAMHCDRSNPFYLVVPANCDAEATTILIDVEVDGIGSTTATLRMPAQLDSCG